MPRSVRTHSDVQAPSEGRLAVPVDSPAPSGSRRTSVFLEVSDLTKDCFTRFMDVARSNPATETLNSIAARILRSSGAGSSAARPASAPPHASAATNSGAGVGPAAPSGGPRVAHLGGSAANPVDLTEDDGAVAPTPPRRPTASRPRPRETLITLDDDVHIIAHPRGIPPGGSASFRTNPSSTPSHPFPCPGAAGLKRKHPSSSSPGGLMTSSSPSASKHRRAGGDGGGDGHKRVEVVCSVCLDVIKNMSSTRCGHVFCTGCIGEVLAKTKTCPTCREKLKPRDVHRVYI